MDSPQSVVSPFKTGEPETEITTSVQRQQSSGNQSNNIKSNGKDSISCGQQQDPVGGTLEVYVHQARDIQNICIYHKQDVYAKLCLTSHPENSVSTKTINGGGRNPVFDDKVKLDVRALDASLKCEIYMMSRVKNYLEDQLLGFALVPLSELLFKNGKLEKEFSLSSTDLYHSPAGFVQLSLSYNGSYPEVMAFPSMASSVSVDEAIKNQEGSESVPDELEKIEFPDPNVANENEKMVSEYIEMSCSTIESETSDIEKHVTSSVTSVMKQDSPESSSNAANGAASPHASAHSATETPNRDHLSLVNSKADSQESESEASAETSTEEKTVVKPIISVRRVETESKVVQQDIVDMYMKSMQQFTDSLAKMKLPLDIDSPTVSEDSSSGDSQKLPTPKSSNKGSRVFYGSRAFF
ncbi:Calcium-dependent lipid-binding (CaLB domain) family protein [Raphanus sativus]|uniref:Uncharacterized protein LOC108847835 n=1 Tax=Raphanus sativus TaxID=3726 RepID=A0A6J0MW64_RAPSA|nr:uncharacterized protein LOC108847835 [Raphanus sativus]XP_056860989.1 uncharacterized protein LOC108847835 [Raphanus sativus]XP_056860990.1 uncharacterized protein LOC108847835 [Raphanus sativus]XP_056860991.1 uncharacterized protein LOC108847835 [Raphanus sativus]XP_056860993.1 uncharacterized protein LOC108847835 [Raphanus sativus]KAJ4907667.1 Calcium-dependent lipid-binding (CaLB domain) family protein [Raphanus sativus]